MAKLELYVSSGPCAPCAFLKNIINKHDLPVDIIIDGSHPMVWDVPTLIMNGTSIIKGVTTIQSFFETHLLPKEVE